MSKNKDENVKTVKIVEITKVKPNPDWPEKVIDEDELQELTDSIKEYGMLLPVLVEDKGDYCEIIEGKRRWQAAKIAGLKEIPITIREYNENVGSSMTELNSVRDDMKKVEGMAKSLIPDYGTKKMIEKFDENPEEFSQPLYSLECVADALLENLILIMSDNKADTHAAKRDLEQCVRQCRHERKTLQAEIEKMQRMVETYDEYIAICDKYRD